MNESTAARVWRDLRTLVLERNERRREVAEALGMSFFRAKALRRIAAAPVTPGDLAADLMTDRPYVTLVVDDLARRGLVERTPHPRDRRSKLLSVTPAGAAAAREADRILNAPPPGLAELDPADLAALDRVVTELLRSASG
ncbi:MarR family transcriptional regulator [Streptomyces sp. ME01-24h]|nr:MarR family transcriptional regulator [Streptomyces sp. ME19-03-3]MDX3354436.1 MarR family transcriptional regulator [Streptomyces sp. ME01-24h]